MKHLLCALHGAGLCVELAVIVALSLRILAEEEWEEINHLLSNYYVPGRKPGAYPTVLITSHNNPMREGRPLPCDSPGPGAQEPAPTPPSWVASSRSHACSGHLPPFGPLTEAVPGDLKPSASLGSKLLTITGSSRAIGNVGYSSHSPRGTAGSDTRYWAGDRADSLETWLAQSMTFVTAPPPWMGRGA